MTGAGYKKGADGIWAKGAQKATVTISTTAGNKGREQVETLLQEQLKAAGFDLKVDNAKAGDLFGQRLPKGNFVIGMYAQVPTPDPGECTIWCSKNIPTAANSFSGQNWDRLKSATLDQYWLPADGELDTAKRIDLVKKGQDALAEEVPAIPLYQKLTLVVWNHSKVKGPIGDNYVLGPFWNLDKWYCVGGKCS
jgi:peptide/nickel transport system substrate-binding protein